VRTGLVVLGVIVLIAGLVWIGQGLGYIKGSFMTGDVRWFWIGVGMVILAIVLSVFSLRRQSRV
jgi:hypothetical protein